SFSSCMSNHLMWSHYADGHRGLAIGFELDENKYIVEKVTYNGLLTISGLPQKIQEVKRIFLNKIKDWDYEDENRIIMPNQDYVEIKIKEVHFGSETSERDKNLISGLVKAIDSKIKIETFYG